MKQVLLVQPEPEEPLFLQALAESGADYALRHVPLDRALPVLRQDPTYAFAVVRLTHPGLRELDLLRGIQQDPGLRTFPVFVCAERYDDRQAGRVYELGAAGYCTLPRTIEGYRELLFAIRHHLPR